MFAAAGIGFGGAPWVGFAIGASLIILFGIPDQLAFFKRYRGQPKTDLILIKLFENGAVIAGALATAWAGYGLRLVLIAYRHGIV
jgi:hypothetical protein